MFGNGGRLARETEAEEIVTAQPARRTVRNWLATALFALAAVLFILVAALYLRDRFQEEPTPPPPPSEPGRAQLVNVVQALRAQGLKTEYARQGVRIPELTAAGQGLVVNGTPLYVFLFEDPATREAEVSELDLTSLTLLSTLGTPVASGSLHTIQGSNVFAVLVGGSEDLITKVDAAITELP
jgi:hypothetical protein